MAMNYAEVTFTAIFFLLLSAFSPSASSQQPPQVTTPTCTFVGKSTSFRGAPVHAYLGIPFAQPPVGDLRFRKPLPPLECDGRPLLTDHLRAACVQFTTTPFPWLDMMPGKDVDCLYLNVWAPPPPEGRRLAVMVFLHGGGFRIGSNRLEYYDGTVMAAVGDVVVVVPNYRLGTEGFLYFGTEDAPGNMGLYDILESLKWVRSNIERFGGDRERVTLFGQSSGAIAITMLMTSPLAEGLFQKAVLQSGSAANLDGEDNERDARLSRAVAEDLGCWTTELTEVVSCLRDVDALLLTKTVGKVSDNPQRGLYPRYGDEILPRNARESFIGGKFRRMPVLVGNNKDEGATMITKVYKDIFGFYGHKDTHINKTFGEYLIRKNFRSFSDLDSLVQHYLGNVEEGSSQDVRQQVQMASGDYARVCPSVFTAEAVSAEMRNPVYYYVFEHRPSHTPFAPWMGVIHFDETPFIFGYPLQFPADYTLHERRLSARMVRIWTDFAKTELPWEDWPLFSRSHPNYVEIKADTSWIKSSPSANCDFYRPYFGFG